MKIFLFSREQKKKILRFGKGGSRKKEVSWRSKGKVLEEVKEFKYLGYVFQRNGGHDAQIRDRVKKGSAVLGQVWGIGKRRFGGDLGKRLWIFDSLV
jgi:hypothetical protein